MICVYSTVLPLKQFLCRVPGLLQVPGKIGSGSVSRAAALQHTQAVLHTHTPTVCTGEEPQHPWRVQAEMIPKSGCILQTWAVPPQSENLLSWRAGDAVDLRSVKSKKENSNFGWASGSPQKPVLVLISLCPHFSICEMVTHTQTPPLKPNAPSDQKFSSKCGAKQNKIKYAIIKMKTTAGKPALHFPEVLSTSSPFSSFYLYLSACTDRHIAN